MRKGGVPNTEVPHAYMRRGGVSGRMTKSDEYTINETSHSQLRLRLSDITPDDEWENTSATPPPLSSPTSTPKHGCV